MTPLQWWGYWELLALAQDGNGNIRKSIPPKEKERRASLWKGLKGQSAVNHEGSEGLERRPGSTSMNPVRKQMFGH